MHFFTRLTSQTHSLCACSVNVGGSGMEKRFTLPVAEWFVLFTSIVQSLIHGYAQYHLAG